MKIFTIEVTVIFLTNLHVHMLNCKNYIRYSHEKKRSQRMGDRVYKILDGQLILSSKSPSSHNL